jgi:hypothetical protein
MCLSCGKSEVARPSILYTPDLFHIEDFAHAGSGIATLKILDKMLPVKSRGNGTFRLIDEVAVLLIVEPDVIWTLVR